MGVAVMAVAGIGGHGFGRDDAGVEDRAILVLKLNGAVADVEMVAEHVVQLFEDAGGLGRRYVGDGDVASQGARL